MHVTRKAGPLLGLATLLALALAAAPARAQTAVLGGTGTNNIFPCGTDSYSGEYQQVYSGAALAADLGVGPQTITSVACDPNLDPSPGTETFTYSIYYTAATPAAPGTSYAANRGTLLFTSSFTGAPPNPVPNTTFEFSLPTGFVYDPALGNLLLDVNVTAPPTGADVLGFTFGASPDTGRVFNLFGDGAPTADPDFGLLTRFTAGPAAVPEPSQTASLGLGALGVLGLMVRARRRRTAA